MVVSILDDLGRELSLNGYARRGIFRLEESWGDAVHVGALASLQFDKGRDFVTLRQSAQTRLIIHIVIVAAMFT